MVCVYRQERQQQRVLERVPILAQAPVSRLPEAERLVLVLV